jgi:membrane protein required for colicin V production
MNWLDVVLVIFLIITTLFGLKNGLIKAILSLAGIIVGVVLAGRYYVFLAERVTFISSPTLAGVVAFAIILVGVMIVATIIARLLGKLASVTMLGWANHLGGAIFGLVFGGLLASAFLAILIKYLGLADPIDGSRIAPILLDYLPLVLSLLPDDFSGVRLFFQ